MPAYEIGITEINTQVRRLGYVSAILLIIGHRTTSEVLLYERLERWSLSHQTELMSYSNPQGFIRPTRRRTSAKNYVEFVVSLGLIGRIAGACRVTRFGKTILPFLGNSIDNNAFRIGLAEGYSYLYWLFTRDSDRLLTILDMLFEKPVQSLALIQKNFQNSYVRRLDTRMSFEEERVARDILAIRNRVLNEWQSPRRYAESIVPPRINWLMDLGLAEISRSYRRDVRLTKAGRQLLETLPKFRDSNLIRISPNWIHNNYFGSLGPILACQGGCQWNDLALKERRAFINILVPNAFSILRTSPAPKVSLLPVLIYIALRLATEERVWANLKDLQGDLDDYSKSPDAKYEMRFSHRENESYLILKSN